MSTGSAPELIAARAALVRSAGRFASVPSPCVSVCRMDGATGLCEGCARTLDEIAAWSAMDDDGKRAVWAEIETRLAARSTDA